MCGDVMEVVSERQVFDDLDMDASCFSDEWRRSVQNSDNLKK